MEKAEAMSTASCQRFSFRAGKVQNWTVVGDGKPSFGTRFFKARLDRALSNLP